MQKLKLSRNAAYTVAMVSLLLVVSMIGGACAKKATPHPNQLNSFDGQTYDALVSAQAALDEAKAQYAAGKFAAVPNAKLIINSGGQAYETARLAWQTWRDISLGVKPGDSSVAQATLQADMNQLALQIANVVKLTTGGK